MNTNYSQNLCGNIAKLRRKSGLTQEQFANRLGISNQAVSKWENNQSCPDVSLLPVIADVFQKSIDELFRRSQGIETLRSGLVAEYLFQGDARDSSGNDRHGKVAGASLCEDRFGNKDSAYYFDGIDDYIILDPAPQINQDAFTLSIWCIYDVDVKLEGWHSAIVSQDGHFLRRVFQISTLDSNITFHRFLLEPDIETPFDKGYWYHIAIIYENNRFKLFRNGVLVREQEGKLVIDSEEPIYIGRKSTDEPSFFFHGKIDDFRIYNRALTSEEIKDLFLENDWEPVKEPEELELVEESLPVLECVEDIQMAVEKKNIQAAAEWYMGHLGFRLLMEHNQEFYMLSLQRGPNLILRSRTSESMNSDIPHFIFKTNRSIKGLKRTLSVAGAKVLEIRDEGFAFFLSFVDPFSHNWLVICKKG